MALLLFPLILILLAVLTTFKDTPHAFTLRAVSTTFAVALVVFIAFLSWGAYVHYHSKAIHVEKIRLPERYADLTDTLDDYPSIKKAINYANPKAKVDVNLEELFKIEEINTKYTKPGDNFFYVRVEDDYYKIYLIKAVGARKLSHIPEKCFRMSETDLEAYPSLKEVINNAKRYGGIHYTCISYEELYEVRELVSEKGNVIEFDGDYYEVLVESTVHLEKIEYPPKCAWVSEEELSEYPTLKEQ